MLILKRFLAFTIDYLIIISYAFLLFTIVNLSSSVFNFNIETTNPIKSQIIAFFTLTLPVFLYTVLTERSLKQGTIGKRVMKIKIKAEKKNILKRNFLKFLPWEIAHTGVHWMYFYGKKNLDSPAWVLFLLIVPQLIIIVYIISIIYTKGSISLYDKFSSSRITIK